jgi:hypothetical protein
MQPAHPRPLTATHSAGRRAGPERRHVRTANGCGHSHRWKRCTYGGPAESLSACPVCRKPQIFDPSEFQVPTSASLPACHLSARAAKQQTVCNSVGRVARGGVRRCGGNRWGCNAVV